MDVNNLWCILLVCLVPVVANSSLEEELEDSDACKPNPCKNDGTCTISNNEVVCICKKQFYGSRCEFDSCEPNPCKNNGRCETENGDVRCSCNHPYVGDYCEEVFDLCQDDPCLNDGVCQMDGGKMKCDCVGPFTGDLCDINVCDPNPCQNNGICTVTENHFICACQEPFTGFDCTAVKEYCSEDTCKNGGLCKMENDKYICECIQGFSGKNCEIEGSKAIKGMDYCYSGPCQNDGTCENMDYDYKCVCNGPYRGKDCDEEISASPVPEITSNIPNTKPTEEDISAGTNMVQKSTKSTNDDEVENYSTPSYTSEGGESEFILNVTTREFNTTNHETSTTSSISETSSDVESLNTTLIDGDTSRISNSQVSERITKPTVIDVKIIVTKTPDIITSSSTMLGSTDADSSQTTMVEIVDPKSTTEPINDEEKTTSKGEATDVIATTIPRPTDAENFQTVTEDSKTTLDTTTSVLNIIKSSISDKVNIVDPNSTTEPISDEERSTGKEEATDAITKTQTIPTSTETENIQTTTEDSKTTLYTTTSATNIPNSSINDKVTPTNKIDDKIGNFTVNLPSSLGMTTIETSTPGTDRITNPATIEIDHNHSIKPSEKPTTENLNTSITKSTDQFSTKKNPTTSTTVEESSTIKKSTVSASTEDEISTPNPSSFESTTMKIDYTFRTVSSTTKELSTVAETSTSPITDEDIVSEITIGNSSPKMAAYVCGAIGACIGIFLLIAGIVHYSKRVKTKKRWNYFEHADSTSVGSAKSTSNLA